MTKNPANQPTADELADGNLRIAAAVAFSGKSRTELYNAMMRGELRYYTSGKHRFIPKRVLVAWLQGVLKPSGS